MKKQDESEGELPRIEWDFSAVAQIELETCLRYELAREIVDWAKYLFIPKYQEGFYTEGKYEEFIHDVNVLAQSSIVPSIVFWPAKDDPRPEARKYFPATPWLRIPLNDRLGTASEFEFGRRAIYHLEEGYCDKADFYEVDKDGNQAIPFGIKWSQSDASILDDFRRWLNEHRPMHARAIVDRGRQSMWDDLRCLSALRLRHVYSVEEAVEVTCKALGKPLYTHRPAWEKACKKAIELFDTTFPGAEGPKSAVKKSNRKSKPGKLARPAKKSFS
jgi:hypothetical protein